MIPFEKDGKMFPAHDPTDAGHMIGYTSLTAAGRAVLQDFIGDCELGERVNENIAEITAALMACSR